MKTISRTGSALLAAASALVLLGSCGGGAEEAAKKAEGAQAAAGQTVTVATSTLTNLPRTVTASGSVSAWENVPVGAETGGLVATGVYVDEGSYVRQGQPLVQLNDALLRAQLAQQMAGVQTAQANAARDDAALGRAQTLKEQGFLSQASLDMALANQRASGANVASAQAALAETRTRLAQATIRAPVAGLIISRSVTKGQIVGAGTELFRMVRDGRLELDAQVPETELALVRSGQGAVVSSDQLGQTTGRVRIVTPEVDTANRLGVARIALIGAGGFRPGMYARAEINVGSQPTVVVPTASVLYRENRAGVFVVGADRHVRFQPLTVQSRTTTQTSVAGLQPGLSVVVDGAGFLGDGDKVNIVRSGAAGSTAAGPAAPAAAAR